MFEGAPSSRRPRIHLISFPRLGKKSRQRRRTKRGMRDRTASSFSPPPSSTKWPMRAETHWIKYKCAGRGRRHSQPFSIFKPRYVLYIPTLYMYFLSINLPVERINFEARPSMIYLSSLSYQGNPTMRRIMHAGQSRRLVTFYIIYKILCPPSSPLVERN